MRILARAVGYGRGLRARADAGRGSTLGARSSSRPPWIARSPDCASPSSGTARGGGRLPSRTRPPAREQPPRPHDRWCVRLRVGTAVASCAPQPVEGLRRLGEPHRDRKVRGRGAMPLAPTKPTSSPSRRSERACVMADPSSIRTPPGRTRRWPSTRFAATRRRAIPPEVNACQPRRMTFRSARLGACLLDGRASAAEGNVSWAGIRSADARSRGPIVRHGRFGAPDAGVGELGPPSDDPDRIALAVARRGSFGKATSRKRLRSRWTRSPALPSIRRRAIAR